VLELYLFGLAVHVVMLLLTATLPDPLATLREIALPVLVVYPLACVAVGLLLIDARHQRTAEAELRESRQRFLAFAEHMPGRLWIRDGELRYLYVNPELAADLGMTEADLIGRRPEELWDERTAAQAVGLCERALQGEMVDVVERWPDEEGRGYFNSRVFAIPGADGTPMLGGLMFDVTLQHTASQQLKRQANQLRRTLQGAVLAMSRLVEARDPYTAGHQRRVAELACAIAREMGLAESEFEGLRLAALVHDLGKISVPAEILAKPGSLSAHEFTLIKTHAQIGHDILADIEFERPVARIVLQHHERLNGSGYPLGLRGDEILKEARVLAVADVYEAMVSHRPYRPGLPREVACAELRDGAGTLYDAAVVDACLRLLAAGFEFSHDRRGEPDWMAGEPPAVPQLELAAASQGPTPRS
jgi:PAS domain S-box-containing protein/putative nucleotidyltransferase with HDIG domain